MNSNKGFFASICSFFSSLFSSAPAEETAAAPAANSDGLTGVERYIRNKEASAPAMTGVEKYIQAQAANTKPLTGVEKYIQAKAAAAPMTGVERYIQSKA